jgi:hypothetical protein
MEKLGSTGSSNDGGVARPSLARLLDEEGFASRDEVEQALAEGLETGERLGEVLLRRAVVDEFQLARLLARQCALPYVDEEQLETDSRALSVLKSDEARALGAVPLRWERGVLQVVVADPSEERLHEVSRRVGGEVRFAVVASSVLERLLARANRGAGESGSEDEPEGPAGMDQSLSILAELAGELDEGTARVLAVRGKLERLAAGLVEREQTIARFEAELADARRSNDRDQNTIAQLRIALAEARRAGEREQNIIAELRRELDRRNELLGSLKTQLSEITDAFARFGVE